MKWSIFFIYSICYARTLSFSLPLFVRLQQVCITFGAFFSRDRWYTKVHLFCLALWKQSRHEYLSRIFHFSRFYTFYSFCIPFDFNHNLSLNHLKYWINWPTRKIEHTVVHYSMITILRLYFLSSITFLSCYSNLMLEGTEHIKNSIYHSMPLKGSW